MSRSSGNEQPAERAFRENVKIIMEQRGLTCKDVAQEAGLSNPTVTQIINEGKSTTLRTVCMIAEALGTTPSDLLKNKETRRARRSMVNQATKQIKLYAQEIRRLSYIVEDEI